MLRELDVTGVRNLQACRLSFEPGFTVVTGANAAGKTSVLEAVHLLGRGRSFRARRLDQVIGREQSVMRVVGVCETTHGSHRLGLEYSQRQCRVRLDGEDVRLLSQLAKILPVQVINTETQRILQDGPAGRRLYLNWGCFHVSMNYHADWQRHERALRQRNAALRSGDGRLARVWEGELVTSGEAVDEARRDLVAGLSVALQELLSSWMPEVAVVVEYRRGWRAGSTLQECFDDGRLRELDAGFTLFGPHRADLLLKVDGVEAQFALSRGQQKLVAIGLMLVQCRQLMRSDSASPLILVDDLAAELDAGRREQVAQALKETSCQGIMTAIEPGDLPEGFQNGRGYRVEQGRVSEMIY
ncbi:DNA replication and repair protein RecF [Natronocella acetinitrilica]|uniref:DNA replication and repair protein RecF n=1 Tax=Natronocella acetinitrilica TaxID=414046 RepID=A0AAE3KAC8_9GAMM|nr:DNA replication/repair protein RecF [Natronocella acetinitrilica]MCP1673369.1 DNA replication and repair protein RecF [Natronocella acetinitrilica]